MQTNTSGEQEKNQNAQSEQALLLENWLAQKKEIELEKLFDEAYEFSERHALEEGKRLIFLQNVWLYIFRENLRGMSDDDLGRKPTVSDDYAKQFAKLCVAKNLKPEPNDGKNFERGLDAERLAQLGGRSTDGKSLNVKSDDERGFSSSDKFKDTRTSIRTDFEIGEQISNVRLTSVKTSQDLARRLRLVSKLLDTCSQTSGQKDVFEGKQAETEQKVAVKFSQNEPSDAATIHEAKIRASIVCQDVPTIISLDEDGVPSIVEPYIKGTWWGGGNRLADD